MPRALVLLLIIAAPGPAFARADPDSEEQLVLDVKAYLADPVARPSHVDAPLPGTFGELALPYLEAIEASRKRVGQEDSETSLRREVYVKGKLPFEKLSRVWRDELEPTRAAVDGVLRATHAQNARLPESMNLFGLFKSTSDSGPGFVTLRHAAKLASIRIQRDLEDGKTEEPEAMCVDVLALARDAGHSQLIGQMFAVIMTKHIMPACLNVARVLDPRGERAFLDQLKRIQVGWPTMVSAFEVEKLFVQLGPLNDSLSRKTCSELPPGTLIQLSSFSGEPSNFAKARRFLFGSWSRRSEVRKFFGLEAATRLPPAEADSVFDRASDEEPLASTLMGSDSSGPISGPHPWTGFMRRWRTGRSRLTLIRTAAELSLWRKEHGHWPASWDEAGLPPPIDTRSGLPFKLDRFDAGVAVSAQPDPPRTDEDLTLAVHD